MSRRATDGPPASPVPDGTGLEKLCSAEAPGFLAPPALPGGADAPAGCERLEPGRRRVVEI